MFDFSQVSDADLADAWKLYQEFSTGQFTGLGRAMMVELDARIHALTPAYFTVNLGGSK